MTKKSIYLNNIFDLLAFIDILLAYIDEIENFNFILFR